MGTVSVGVHVAVAVTIGQAPVILPPPTGPTFLWLASQYGDSVGNGETRIYQPGVFSVGGDSVHNSVVFSAHASDNSWHAFATIAAPVGQFLAAGGVYDGAVRFATARQPGVDFSLNGHGCNATSGSFIVLDLAYGPAITVSRLHVTFVQYCDGGPPLTGEIWYVQ